MNIVLDAGADDLRNDGESWEVLSPPEAQEPVLKALAAAGIETASSQVAMIPKNLMLIESKNAGSHAAVDRSVLEEGTTTCRTSSPTSTSTRRSWRAMA